MGDQVLLAIVGDGAGWGLVSLPGRLTLAGFRERHGGYQTLHAMAGRPRVCPCCGERLPARDFEGANLVCWPCASDIEGEMVRMEGFEGFPAGWRLAEGR